MPMTWENSRIDRIQLHFTRLGQVRSVADGVRIAIEPVILPDAAMILTAIASDVMEAVRARNDRPDVIRACSALEGAIAALEALGGKLDG